MRIGITTWHTGTNPGTFFQVFGLYKFLTDRGGEVKVIDYKQTEKTDLLPRGLRYYLSNFIGSLQVKFKRKKWPPIPEEFKAQREEQQKKYKRFYGQMEMTSQVSTDEDFKEVNSQFDCFIVGSDQIWNPNMLNRRYLLDYADDTKIKASFAPSCGVSVFLPKQIENYAKYTSRFNYISTRERVLADVLTKRLKREVEHVVDPSMLLSREYYDSIAQLPEGFEPNSYVLCYFMPKNESQRDQVRAYAKANNLKIVMLAALPYEFSFSDATIYAAAGPDEWLGLIKNAHTVFTSSFHCTIFSLLFHKNLFSYQQEPRSKTYDMNIRYVEIMKRYNAMHRFVLWGADLTPETMVPIDYDHYDSEFNAWREKSIKFLTQFV